MGPRIGWGTLGIGSAIAVIAASSSAGCSSSDTATAGSDRAFETTVGASGSRLRARFVGSGDAKLLVGFHDNERDEDCTFQKAERDKIRCLPESLATTSAGPEVTTFSDAACQAPVVLGIVPACSDVKYAVRSTSVFDPSCPGVATTSVQDIRKRDPNVPSTTYTNTTGGSPSTCTTQPTAVQQGVTLAAFGEVVPWTAFVEATETEVPRDGGAIIERVLVATDGARQHMGYRAPINGVQATCSFHIMADGITRCVPDKSLTGPVAYSDAACTKALFVRDASSTIRRKCSAAGASDIDRTLWSEPSGNVCGGIGAVYALGDTFTGEIASVFSWDAERNLASPSSSTNPPTVSCRLESVNPPTSSAQQQGLRSVSANLTSSLPSSRRWRNGGRGARLVSALVPIPGASPNGSVNQLQQGFHDSERDVDCTFERATDGKLRCLPVAASAVIFNTDGECKSASTVAVFSSSPCAASSRFARVTIPGTCPAVTKIYSLSTTPRDVPNVSTRVTADGCSRVQQVIGAVDATEVDPSQFVEGSATTE